MSDSHLKKKKKKNKEKNPVINSDYTWKNKYLC